MNDREANAKARRAEMQKIKTEGGGAAFPIARTMDMAPASEIEAAQFARGMTRREYHAANSGITFQDAALAITADATGQKDAKSVALVLVAMRLAYADLLMLGLEAMQPEGDPK